MAKVKAKDARTMIFDENGFRLRASCLCFKDNTTQKV